MACPDPATTRCLGWNREFDTVECGEGYKIGSPLCGVCRSGYFEEDGECRACPSTGSGFLLQVVPLLAFAGFALIMYLSLLALLTHLFKRHGVKVTRARLLRIPFDYVFWTLMALQLLAQVGRLPMSGVPPLLRSMFNMVQLVQLDVGGVAPPECTGESPFARLLYVCFGACALVTVWLGLVTMRSCIAKSLKRHRGMLRALHLLRYAALTGLLVVYPLTINACFATLDCSSGVFEGKERWVWNHNTYYFCFEGQYTTAVFIALPTLLIVGLVIPMALLLAGRRLVHRVTQLQQKDVDGASPRASRPGLSHPGSLPPRRCGCCPQWCCVSRELHATLRRRRAWVPVFGFGQPWFRTSYLYFLLWLALLEWVPASSFAVSASKAGVRVASIAAFGIAVLLLRPDHEWGEWRRWPRFGVAMVSCLVAALQLSLLMTHGQGGPAASVVKRDGTVASQPPTPSLVSIIIVYGIVAGILAFPFVQFVAFSLWLRRVAHIRGCCGCGGSSHGPKPSKGAAAALSMFAEDVGGGSDEPPSGPPTATPHSSRRRGSSFGRPKAAWQDLRRASVLGSDSKAGVGAFPPSFGAAQFVNPLHALRKQQQSDLASPARTPGMHYAVARGHDEFESSYSHASSEALPISPHGDARYEGEADFQYLNPLQQLVSSHNPRSATPSGRRRSNQRRRSSARRTSMSQPRVRLEQFDIDSYASSMMSATAKRSAYATAYARAVAKARAKRKSVVVQPKGPRNNE